MGSRYFILPALDGHGYRRFERPALFIADAAHLMICDMFLSRRQGAKLSSAKFDASRHFTASKMAIYISDINTISRWHDARHSGHYICASLTRYFLLFLSSLSFYYLICRYYYCFTRRDWSGRRVCKAAILYMTLAFPRHVRIGVFMLALRPGAMVVYRMKAGTTADMCCALSHSLYFRAIFLFIDGHFVSVIIQ